MRKQELLDFVNTLDDNSNIRFAVWNEETNHSEDLELTLCSPTGRDGITRLGLSTVKHPHLT